LCGNQTISRGIQRSNQPRHVANVTRALDETAQIGRRRQPGIERRLRPVGEPELYLGKLGHQLPQRVRIPPKPKTPMTALAESKELRVQVFTAIAPDELRLNAKATTLELAQDEPFSIRDRDIAMATQNPARLRLVIGKHQEFYVPYREVSAVHLDDLKVVAGRFFRDQAAERLEPRGDHCLVPITSKAY